MRTFSNSNRIQTAAPRGGSQFSTFLLDSILVQRALPFCKKQTIQSQHWRKTKKTKIHNQSSLTFKKKQTKQTLTPTGRFCLEYLHMSGWEGGSALIPPWGCCRFSFPWLKSHFSFSVNVAATVCLALFEVLQKLHLSFAWELSFL